MTRSIAQAVVVFCALSTFSNCNAQDAAAFTDVTVIPSQLHENGGSTIKFEKAAGGGQVLNIAPEIHVHQNYFSGNREVQAPIVHGGPTVLVCRHPKTNEQMYIELSLPPGAPKVAYTKNKIEYIYKNQRIGVKFWTSTFGGHSKAGIFVQQGSGFFGSNKKMIAANNNLSLKEKLQTNPVVAKWSGLGGGKAASGARNLVNKLPLVQPLKSLMDSKPQRQAMAKIDRLAAKRAAEEPKLFKTNQ